MATETSLELRNMVVQPTTSTCQTLGMHYNRSGHSFEYSPTLTQTGKSYDDSKEQIPEGSRISLSADELALQLPYERIGKIIRTSKTSLDDLEGKDFEYIASALNLDEKQRADLKFILDIEGRVVIDPRKAEVFSNLFGKDGWYAWQWTGTFLRVPKGKQNPSKPDYRDIHGRKYWIREIGEYDEVKGITSIPEGNSRAVVEVDEVWGIAKVTSNQEGDLKMENHTTHFCFNPNPQKDPKTGEQDVALARRGAWPLDEHEWCLYLNAHYERWDPHSYHGLRQVRGPVPEIKTLVELEKMRLDFREMNFPEFQRKYNLK